MPVVFDASFLVPMLDPQVKGGDKVDVRIGLLLKALEKDKAKIIIPTPALSEVLIGAGNAAPQYLAILSKSARFKIVPFGERAAVEAAEAHRQAISANDKREGAPSKAKLKFDRQIIAIAKVERATIIFSNDGDIERYARADGIKVINLEQLPLSVNPQGQLFDEGKP